MPENEDEKELKRAASEVLTQIEIDFNMTLFAVLEKHIPAAVADIRGDYEAWIQKIAELQATTGGHFTNSDVQKALPGNQWGPYIREVMLRLIGESPNEGEITEDVKEHFLKKVRKHLQKKDIS